MSALREPALITTSTHPTRLHPTGPAGLPSTGLVLIGTAQAVRAMALQLAAISAPGHPIIPTGCVLVHHLERGVPAPDAGLLPPVLGYTDELIGLHAQWRFKAALVSLPASMRQEARRVSGLLTQLGINERCVPTFEDILQGASPAGRPGRATPMDPATLIGRTPWGVDKVGVSKIIRNKRVLITGAGGSIGSELARVCAAFKPEQVILMERSENALFEIDQQLSRRFPALQRRAILHDIVDEPGTRRVLEELRPHAVFHAAAHKHVPLMEEHPSHALSNNLFGTKSVADACIAAGVERFVMISSDKAVNPTSVMGATKRLAEMYVQGLASGAGPKQHTCRLSMVRFGNVLASACSVIPIWSQQLAEGHPITVTDPRMTRYFMTIPEAATLVVQAAALEQAPGTSPVYVLDMGEPISILEMAVRFLRQQGLGPEINPASIPPAALAVASEREQIHQQIAMLSEDEFDTARHPIVFTGARPGEKLYEELAYSAEMLTPTTHPAIGQWRSKQAQTNTPAPSRPTPPTDLAAALAPMRDAARPKQSVIEAIQALVPEMRRGTT